MNIEKTPIEGAYVITLKPIKDERGFFARSFCQDELVKAGLEPFNLAQQNISYNRHRATLRGMHYQLAPHAEIKLVRCTKGAVWDAIVDLRPDSSTYLKWYGLELKADDHKTFYIPKGCAHGFLTLADDSELFYQLSEPFKPELYRALHWNDPTVNIQWPLKPELISPKDAEAPLWQKS